MKNLVKGLLIGLAAIALAAPSAWAKWPNDRNVTIVVNWPPGTTVDAVARILADGLSKKWNATVVVENRAGATGNIGQNYVAKAAPDGYTFLITTPGPAANNVLTFKALPYDPIKDFVGVSQTTQDTMGIVVGKKPEFQTFKGFVDYAKANPGKAQIAHPGHGTYAHMIMLALQDELKTEFNLIPYKGGVDMANDLLSGRIDAIVNFVGPYAGQFRTGDLKPLVVISDARNETLPNAPTLKESGINFSAAPWTIMQAPKGTPKEIVDEMSKGVNEILKDPAVAAKIAGMNTMAKASTPEFVDQLVLGELDKWKPVITKYKITNE
jgi:tripartite-type tricarboxylate transporter receptor subunit TctC